MRRSPRLTRPGPIRRSWRDLNPWIHDDELCWLHTCLQGFKLLKCDTLPQNTKTVTAFRHKYFPLFSSTNLKYFLSEIIHTQENRSRGTHSAKSLISNFIKGLAYSKMMSCVDCKIVPQLSIRFWIPKLWHLVSKILKLKHLVSEISKGWGLIASLEHMARFGGNLAQLFRHIPWTPVTSLLQIPLLEKSTLKS